MSLYFYSFTWCTSISSTRLQPPSYFPNELQGEFLLILALYGYETWSLTPTEERKLRILEKTMLRRIFGPEREAREAWKMLRNEQLYNLNFSEGTIRVNNLGIRCVEHVERTVNIQIC